MLLRSLFPFLLLTLVYPPLPLCAFRLPRIIRIGLTYEPCQSDTECIFPPRKCLSEAGLLACRPPEPCICFPEAPLLCTTTTICPAGESCASKNGAAPMCISDAVIANSPDFVPSQGPDSPAPSTSDQLPILTDPSASPPTASNPFTSSAPPPSPSSSLPPSIAASPPASLIPTPAPATPSPLASPSRTPAPSVAVFGPTLTPPVTSPASPASLAPPSPSPPTLTAPTQSSPPDSAPLGPSGGLAGDPCTTQDDCLDYRQCLDRDSSQPCVTGVSCSCFGSRTCQCDDQCPAGELCSGRDGESLCFSRRFLDTISWATNIPCEGAVSVAPSPSMISGLTGDLCRFDENCLPPRRCRAGGGDSCAVGEILCQSTEIKCSTADEVCYCYNSFACECTSDCFDSEVCVSTPRGKICVSRGTLEASEWLNEVECGANTTVDDPDVVNVPLPPSPESTNSPGTGTVVVEITPTVRPEEERPEPTVDPACVDARALEGMDLVFEKHVVKEVLCDARGSCATEGHMVIWKGVAMMMRSYCELAGCARRIIEVNSPKRLSGLRVDSKTAGLEYTAFAARWATRLEEAALSIAVRAGL
eukprot:GFKZ01005176.1.p1 GENE.GFKZ01005176.1~~GFKZ01005176.1.p1  ORF type:complete len:589 (+),score=34.04 GFKZ01005176.1:334-2100(+)